MILPLKRAVFNLLVSSEIKKRLRPIVHAVEDFLDGDLLKSNAALKNRYLGKRCFILGTGSSLAEVEIDKLDDEYTFGTGYLGCPELDVDLEQEANRYLHVLGNDPYAERVHPLRANRGRFVSCANLSFFSAMGNAWAFFVNRRERQSWLDFYAANNAAFPRQKTIFFMNGADRRFFERHNVLAGRKKYYVKSAGPLASCSMATDDLTRRINFMDGSFFFMVAASIYMGFKELFLCGCGHSYYPNHAFHFYDEPAIPLDMPKAKRDKVLDAVIKNCGVELHGIKEEGGYYRPTFAIHRPVDAKHEVTREFAGRRGVKIYNVVPDGFASPVYQKISWSEIERELLEATPAAYGEKEHAGAPCR